MPAPPPPLTDRIATYQSQTSDVERTPSQIIRREQAERQHKVRATRHFGIGEQQGDVRLQPCGDAEQEQKDQKAQNRDRSQEVRHSCMLVLRIRKNIICFLSG